MLWHVFVFGGVQLRLTDSLEEVLFAVDTVSAGEALLCQLWLTVATFQTLAVPVTVQHLQDEAVHDVLTATRTHRDIWKTQQQQQ